MEWTILCDYYEAMKMTLRALDFHQVTQTYWKADNYSIFLKLNGIDGLTMKVNGQEEIYIPRSIEELYKTEPL